MRRDTEREAGEWMAIGVIVTHDKAPIVVRDIDISSPTHTILGEQFVRQDNVSDFLYDWLRNKEGLIVGVRFPHTNNNDDDHILGRRNVVDHGAEGLLDSFTIFFGSERDFIESKEQLWLDFAGRELYIGGNGSTMFTFYLLSDERVLGE